MGEDKRFEYSNKLLNYLRSIKESKNPIFGGDHSLDDIIENLKHMDSVKEVHGTFGAYDVVAKVEHDEKDN